MSTSFSSHHRTLFEILILFFQIVSVYLSPNEFRYWLCSTTPILPRRTRLIFRKEHIICDEQMERFVRHVFRNHSGKSCVRDKKKAALPGGIPWSRRVWKTGQRGKAFQSCWLVFSSVMFWSERLLTRAKMSADRQTVVRGPSFMGWG